MLKTRANTIILTLTSFYVNYYIFNSLSIIAVIINRFPILLFKSKDALILQLNFIINLFLAMK